jgi:hypothetical protein
MNAEGGNGQVSQAEYTTGDLESKVSAPLLLSMLAKYIHDVNADYRRIRQRIPLGPLHTQMEYD